MPHLLSHLVEVGSELDGVGEQGSQSRVKDSSLITVICSLQYHCLEFLLKPGVVTKSLFVDGDGDGGVVDDTESYMKIRVLG